MKTSWICLYALLLSSPLFANELSYSELNYLRGALAYEDGEFKQARNYWHRYLEFQKIRGAENQDERVFSVQERYDELNQELIEEKKLKGKPRKRKTAKRRPRKKVEPVLVRPEQARRQALAFEKQARRVEANGQLEFALKLYQLAYKLDSSLSDVKKRIKTLEKQMY